MTDKVKIEFELEENCCADIQLMSIWLEASRCFSDQMTMDQYKAALAWFNSYVNESFADELVKPDSELMHEVQIWNCFKLTSTRIANTTLIGWSLTIP